MLDAGTYALVRQPHQFVGYWGLGDMAVLERRLAELLRRVGEPSVVRRRTIEQLDQSEVPLAWNVAYLGLDGALSGLFAEADLSPGISGSTWIAARSASGLLMIQPDGLWPDAWVSWVQVGNTGELQLGRDPFGRVPLYWMQQNDVIWFASRMELLLPLSDAPVSIDLAALYGYACFSYVPTPLTPIQSIRAVPAGTRQVWQLDLLGMATLTHAQYRSLEWQAGLPEISDEGTAIVQLQTHLRDAVERQVSDGLEQPVGVFLSGGLDSSIVAALLVQLGVQVRAYTLDFGDRGSSEIPYAEQVAHHLQIPLVKVAVTPRQIAGSIAATAAALDLPFGDGVTVPLYCLNRVASQETAVVFNGEHGDQLFAGWTNKPLIAAGIYGSLLPDLVDRSNSPESQFYQQYLRTFHRLYGYESQIFQADLLAELQGFDPQDWLREALDPAFATSLLHRLRRASLMLKGAQNIQPRATALATAHGLQVRSPFCDLPLAEWTFRLSGSLCLQGACEKYILKRAVAEWLPEAVVWRTKRGMGVPLTSWCMQELWHELGQWLNPSLLRAQSHWQPDLAARIVAGQLGGGIQGRRIGETLWLLIMWQAWRQVTLRESPPARSWDHPFWWPRSLWQLWQTFRHSDP